MKLKKYIGVLVIALTFLVFGMYLKNNNEVITQIQKTNLATIIIVLALYSLMTVVLIVMSKLILTMSGLSLSNKENAFLTMYSSIINFFGPLQSGPGFRIVYLKKKHKLKVGEYFKVSLLYYLFFAIVSGLFLINQLLGFLLSILAGVLALLAIRIYLIYFSKIINIKLLQFGNYSNSNYLKLFWLTLLQLVIISTAYFVELTSVNSSISYSQALIYCGAANFSLFVSLTPGALGIRESFIFFSQKLHDIPTSTIISTSILDRSLFILFLALMFIVILLLHGKDYIRPSRSKSTVAD